MILYRLAKWMEEETNTSASITGKAQKSAAKPETDKQDELILEQYPQMKEAVERFQEKVPYAEGRIP